jgi:hypothetical protein
MSVALNSTRARAYASALFLDQFETGGSKCGMLALEYQAHARTLKDIFEQAPSNYSFSDLLRNSTAALEISESLELERRLVGNRAANCPVLDTLLGRI